MSIFLYCHYILCFSAAFCTKSMMLESGVIKYQIWDTAGQEKASRPNDVIYLTPCNLHKPVYIYTLHWLGHMYIMM